MGVGEWYVYDERRGPVLSSMDRTSRSFSVSSSGDSSRDDDCDIESQRVWDNATRSRCLAVINTSYIIF